MKTISSYTHAPLERRPKELPDTAPGPYYVSVRDGGRLGLLLGPFETHKQALDVVDDATAKSRDVCPFSAFYSFGTVRMVEGFNKPGVLNRFFPQLDYYNETSHPHPAS